MTTALDRILAARGFEPRKQQVNLYEHLIKATNTGVVAQAGTGVGKSLAILAAATHLNRESGQQSIIVTPTLALMDQYCLAPGTRVLTGDLRYVPIESLSVGDALVGFDEVRTGKRRNYRNSTVESVQIIQRPCYDLHLTDGTVIRSSEEHRWLVKSAGRSEWVKTSSLSRRTPGRNGSRIIKPFDTWDEDLTRSAGYLAAAYDGEGSLYQGGVSKSQEIGNAHKLTFSQRDNIMLQRVREAMASKGLAAREYAPTSDSVWRLLMTNRRDVSRLLGSIRPERLLANLDIDRMGSIDCSVQAEVIRKEFVGLSDVVAIKTSTHTFIAEGFASHNCNSDLPAAQEAFPEVAYAELRGANHYHCDQTASLYVVGTEDYPGGCATSDAHCSQKAWIENDYRCDYRAARAAAMEADVVITNTAMLMVNDFILAEIPSENRIYPLSIDPDSSLFVDEAHMLEAKIRDWFGRSMWNKDLTRFSCTDARVDEAARSLGFWLSRQSDGLLAQAKGFPMDELEILADYEVPEYLSKKTRQIADAAERIRDYIKEPHDSAVLHVNEGSLKTDWINVSRSSGEILQRRRFGLVSATIPKSLPSTLGVPNAPFVDVGHPFDYSKAFIGFSAYSGAYKDAQNDWNFDFRVKEVEDLIRRAKGGALLLFSAFTDLERVYTRLSPMLKEMGLTVLKQEPGVDKAELARIFREDGNAVLFGSETFAAGFDVPGWALRLVVLHKLPFPARTPANDAIMKNSMKRYQDAMTVRAVQGIGRLIRSTEDSGIVWVADSRGGRLINRSDPLTAHLAEFSRL